MCPAEDITLHPVNHCLPNMIHWIRIRPVICLRFSLNRLTFVFIQTNFQRKLYVTTINEKPVSFADLEGDGKRRMQRTQNNFPKFELLVEGAALKAFPLFC